MKIKIYKIKHYLELSRHYIYTGYYKTMKLIEISLYFWNILIYWGKEE